MKLSSLFNSFKFAFVVLLLNLAIFFWLWPEPGIDKVDNLPIYGKNPKQTAMYDPIVKLAKKGDPFCTAFVIDANYALTAAHCISDAGGNLRGGTVQILLFDDMNSGVIAKPVAVNNRVDAGLVRGDFSNFKLLQVDFYEYSILTEYSTEDKFEACGYPYGQRYLTCTPFYPRSNSGFAIAGHSFLIPGMSGGPLINTRTGRVVGINIAMGHGWAYAASTLGLLGAFGIEP